ncbi:MAG TPA: hypothetical protein VGD60_07265 [Candidatus Acidoferrales bacterium]
MRIDATHRKWLIASAIIFGAALFVYIAYAASSPAGPSGGSAIGLTFGVIGFAFMIFAGLLAARKKVAVWRLGRAQTWMRGHLWLGLLSLPMIFFHAGFQFGGVLTKVLMILLITVVASGLLGAALQHYMPRMMTSDVPMETIFEQIDHVRDQLVVEADSLVHRVCGSPQTENVALSGGGSVAVATAAPAAVVPLRDFYTRQLRPFLKHRHLRNQPLARSDVSARIFDGLRTVLPETAHDATRKLEEICEEERQLRRQVRMHHWLHGWLMLHIPLSLALLLLGCIHAIMALRY